MTALAMTPERLSSRTPRLTLFGRITSSNVQKALWCLDALGLPFERVDIGGPFGGNRDAPYLALNPNGVIPTLVDETSPGKVVVWESNTVARYLCNRYGPTAWYPDDARMRAQVEQWMDWQISTLNPGITPLFKALIRTPEHLREPAAIEAHHARTEAAMTVLNGALEGREWLASEDAPSLAEVAMGASVYRWFELPVQRAPLGALADWYARLQGLPEFRRHVMIGLT